MPFNSHDQFIQALSRGQSLLTTWSKNFNPTTAAVAGEVHLMARGAGNPTADSIFDVGANLTFQPVKDTTVGGGQLLHGGNVQGTGVTKHLSTISAVTASPTVVPSVVALIDIVWFYRVTTVTTTTAQATTNTLAQVDNFTADAGSDICTFTTTVNIPSNLLTGTVVRLTTSGTLPAGLALATDYFYIRISDSTFKLATTYANSLVGTAIDITSTGTGTHTTNWLLPRYTNGAGLKVMIFNPSATPLGAGTPNLSIGYTNSTAVAGRATPTLPYLPIGKTGASNSLILYSGTGVGKINYELPMQWDAGVRSIENITNSTSYVSGSYTVALYKELARVPISVLGVPWERNTMTEVPGLPQVYDGAALYFLTISGAAIPVNSNINGNINFIWN